MGKAKTKHVAVRLPTDLEEYIDNYIEQHRIFGRKVTKSEAILKLLRQGVEHQLDYEKQKSA